MIIIIGYFFLFSLKVSEYQPQSASTARRHRLHGMISLKKGDPDWNCKLFNGICLRKYYVLYLRVCRNKSVFEYVSLFFIVFAATMISVRPFTGRLYDEKVPMRWIMSFIKERKNEEEGSFLRQGYFC